MGVFELMIVTWIGVLVVNVLHVADLSLDLMVILHRTGM